MRTNYNVRYNLDTTKINRQLLTCQLLLLLYLFNIVLDKSDKKNVMYLYKLLYKSYTRHTC